jgi:hypothetical protein
MKKGKSDPLLMRIRFLKPVRLILETEGQPKKIMRFAKDQIAEVDRVVLRELIAARAVTFEGAFHGPGIRGID